MHSIKSLVIIGSGNVAKHLGWAFKDAGLEIYGIYSQTFEHAKSLAKKLDTKAFASIAEIPTNIDAYLVAVTDSVLPRIINECSVFQGIIMHTSGSIGLDVFPEKQKKVAVFYPLQTFSKEKSIDFLSAPILIESKETEVIEILQELGEKISKIVKPINSKQRKELHLAAVFACNFSNYMYQIAFNLLKENELDFDLLKPLIAETVEKLNFLSPSKAQTGPAIRNDEKIIQYHLDMLKKHSEYQQLYKQISRLIQESKS